MKLDQIGKYWDIRAEGYSLSNMAQYESEAKDDWEAILLESAPKKSCLRCLDVGCGPGFLGILMAEKGHHVTSIDYSEEMLARADKNSRYVGVNLRLMRMDAQKLNFEDHSFDYIFCRDLTWNLEKPREAYAEWLRVLSPGGRLLVADSNHYLHYYNKDFMEEYNSRTFNDHPHMLGVDPTPIDEIARSLPLSREYRPAWDIKTLLELGADSVSTTIKRRRFTSQTTSEEKSVIFSFRVTADKSQ